MVESESRDEFDSFLVGLRASLQPVGTLEETLVDQLAVSYWRYRRLLIAETAEIAKGRMAEDKPNEAALFQRLVVRQSSSPSLGSLLGAFINRSPE